MSAPTRVANARTAGKVAAVPDSDDPVKPGRKSRRKLLIVAVTVALLAGGGWYFVTGRHAKPGPPKPGPVVGLDAQTLNLADGHFLKLKLGLQTVAGKDTNLDTSKAADLTIAEFTGRPMSSLSTDAARTALKTDLLRKLQAAYPGQLMGVYYTVFVMQ